MSRHFFGTHGGQWMLGLRINQGYLTNLNTCLLFKKRKKEKYILRENSIKLDPVIRHSQF